MRLLLTSRRGQVGFDLQRALAPLGDIVAVDRRDCNLADGDAIRRLVRNVRPDVIVNPAAYTAVDKAESDRATAFAVNAVAPRILGEEAARLDAFVVHYSTDYVFDGDKPGPYTEEDVTNPQNVYGESKRDGELALLASCPRHVILRTSWVVGAHGGNFAKTILRLASERHTISVVADQWVAPTSAALLADVTAHLIRQQHNGPQSFPYGIYHCVAGGGTSWYEYARYVVGAAIEAGLSLKATPLRHSSDPEHTLPDPCQAPGQFTPRYHPVSHHIPP